MAWWVWVLVGLGLLGLEVLTPGGFFVLFFGLGALAVGLLVGLGAGGPAWFQLLLFSVLSAVTLLLFRRRVMAWMGAPERDVGGLVGDVGVLLEDLPPGTVGKAELRGTVWSVRHEGTQVLARGLRVRVARVDGLMLHVRPE